MEIDLFMNKINLRFSMWPYRYFFNESRASL